MSGRKVKTEGIYSGLRADGLLFPEVLRGVKEIAAYLRMGTRATERWIANGMLPAPKDAKGRRWTTKSLIDKLIVQIYQLEQEGKGVLKTGKKQPRPRPGQLPAGGTVQELKPETEPASHKPDYCPYCQGEGSHKAGCMLLTVRPITSAKPGLAFKTTIESIEIPGIGEGGKPVRGRLIISEPVDPESRMGQSVITVEGELTERAKQGLREWWKRKRHTGPEVGEKDVPEGSQEKPDPTRAEHVIIHTGIIKQEDRGRLGPEFGEGALDRMPGVGGETLIISEEVANAPCAYCDQVHPNPADCRVWPERSPAGAGDIPDGPLLLGGGLCI